MSENVFPGVPLPIGDGKRKGYPLHLHISVIFTLLIFASGAVIGISNYIHTRDSLLAAAEEDFRRLAQQTAEAIDRLHGSVDETVSFMSRSALTKARDLEERLASLPMMLESLRLVPNLTAVYCGYENGDFLILRRLDTAETRRFFSSPAAAAYLAQSIGDGGKTRTEIFYDSSHAEISRRPWSDPGRFDPRPRPWYVEAMKTEDSVLTPPYVFFATGEAGQTMARRSTDSRSVVGADMTLASINRFLDATRPMPSAETLLFDRQGRIAHYSRRPDPAAAAAGRAPSLSTLDGTDEPLVREVGRRYSEGLLDTPAGVDAFGERWHLLINNLGRDRDTGYYLAVLAPEHDIQASAWKQAERGAYLAALVLLVSVPVTWFFAGRISRDLRALSGAATGIRRFDFSSDIRVVSMITEVQELSNSLDGTRSALRHFLDINSVLASERDFGRLLEIILRETVDAADAGAGIIYLVSEEGDSLTPEASKRAEDGPFCALAGTTDAENRLALSPIPLKDGRENQIVAAMSDIRSRVAAVDVEGIPETGLREALGGSGQAQLIATPLRNSDGSAVGVLCLYRRTGRKLPDRDMLSFLEKLSGGAAISIENHRLLREQKRLLDSFIAALAGAIDAKSHYTGGHCQRVPVLAQMLAEAAGAVDGGPLAEFRLDAEGREALRIGAWLHDCGKVTTPEYVVDKATKLEGLCNRIHEIRTRFEVLKRDAEIACLRTIAAGGDREGAEAAMRGEWKSLDDDFRFVASCNLGGEFLSDDSVERLRRIAARTWRRSFSDRLGLSREELLRKEPTPEPELPATESLLADKPEHLIGRETTDILPADPKWGFTIKMPAHKYNQGELYNLSVRRGTLNAEERYKINDHIVQTIILLSRLPFPRHLRQVPEIAGGHHERVDGGGYPRGLKGSEMSVEARIMAVADIFEALTAADRPYKPIKSLSESLTIMARMVKEGHLDADLFETFVSGGVYRRYAEQYLHSDQMDAVDEASVLRMCR